jgi:hypothetical protein
MIESPHNLYVLFVKACLCDSFERSSRSGVALTRSQQMVRGRRAVRPRSAVYDIDQTQVGREHASELGKYKQVECDIAIHRRAAVTYFQYKQSAEPERQKHGVWLTRSVSQGQV